MKDDLLILRLLKVPVIIIKYLSKSLAMLTYLPNYLLILILDAIIFNEKLISNLFSYCISWPFRFIASVSVVGVFCAQFYGMYSLLSISHFHWGIQLALSFIAFQGVLALMRHGYLTMINKFSPKKLKSPKEHLQQIWFMIIDILGLILTIINVLLVVNIFSILKYDYKLNGRFIYLFHIARLIRKSILDIIKLFYIKIFFRVFPWRYKNSISQVNQQADNILQLSVLLTLLFLMTVVDLIFFIFFGFYCAVIHPRRKIYHTKIGKSHAKFKITGTFVVDTLIQIMECIVLLFCLPFKYNYSKQVLALVVAKQNNYSFHYLQETAFVLKLALIKIPSLFCELILLIFYYKYKKITYLSKIQLQKQSNKAHPQQKKPLFKSKFEDAAAIEQQEHKVNNKSKKINPKLSREQRYSQRQYLVFKCFGSLFQQIWFLGLIPICTLLKIWNFSWLKFLVNQKQDLRVSLVVNYFFKTVLDYIDFIPSVITSLILGFYDPIQLKTILKDIYNTRKQVKQKIPKFNNSLIINQKFQFFNSTSAIMPALLKKNFQQIKKDILFLPLFIACRISLISSMDCQHPKNSVQLFEHIWMLFYMKRVQRSAYFNQYLQLQKADQAAGMIKTPRERLRFWKFAHKSLRHRLISKIISFMLPKKLANKAIDNAKKQNNFSAIANHYWHCYNITFSLLKYLMFFIIQLIVTLFGVIVLMPLTLWRMPTFLILFKTHEFKKSMFFKILFPMYKQMLLDLLFLFARLCAILIFPRAYLIFCYKTSFRYTKHGVEQFQKIQKVKMQYIIKNILIQGFKLYIVIFKILFVKILWVRKRDMNLAFNIENIRLSKFFINFMSTSQYIPSLYELKAQQGGFNLQNQIPNIQQSQKKALIEEKQKQIRAQGVKIIEIVEISYQLALEDLPYLLLMIFLLFTLPWRYYYLKKALLLMREDKDQRRYFVKFLRVISKDYLCILLYLVLIFSVIKTKRAVSLFYRNFKLNFYVGTLKYSHLKQLKLQLAEAVHFYFSLVLIVFSFIFGPYRIAQIYQNVKNLYKKYCAEVEQQKKNAKMYENTIKQGKSLQLITTIGNNSLLHVFRFLDARELTNMTKVSKYMYQTIKQRDQVWVQQWQRVYATKYPSYAIKDDTGQLSYNAMCVEMFKQQNVGLINNSKDRFYLLALKQLKQSTSQTQLDLKAQLLKILPQQTSKKIFTSLKWDHNDGYGPEQNWPRPDDNQQFLQLMGIQRRQIVSLDEKNAFFSWFFERPIEFIINKLNHFYQVDTHRRKKQIIFVLTNFIVPIVLFGILIFSWSDFWQLTPFIGYKILVVVHFILFCYIFFQRYKRQSSQWIAIHPFDIKDDIIYYFTAFVKWTKQKSIKAGNFIKSKFQNYVVKPICWIWQKISKFFKWIFGKVKRTAQLFIEKVAKPLYISISHKIQALWRVIKDLCRAFVSTIKAIFNFIGKIFRNIYNFLFQIVKGISKLYSNTLQFSLRLSLKFGTLGQLIFTIIAITCMISPSLVCYFYYTQRWFIILSTLMTMVLMVTGYKHLTKMKEKVLQNK